MTSTRVFYQASGAFVLTLGVLAGCNSIVGLDKIEVLESPAENAGAGSGGLANPQGGTGGGSAGDLNEGGTGDIVQPQGGEAGAGGAPQADECQTNQQCSDELSAGAVGEGGSGSGAVAAACIHKPYGHCVQLLSEDCDSITGDYLNDSAIFIGSLFQTKGSTAATNLDRQRAAILGVEQINKPAGGVPIGSTSANARPLVMVSCDASADVLRAAKHLVTDLQVPAIVGPNTSQDTLNVSTKVSVPGGTVVMSPSGVASSIADLSDDDLTWLMVPSDVQRAPLMIDQINELETQITDADLTKKTVKLGIVYRDDALGQGTRAALSSLTFNGKSLTDPVNQNAAVQIDPYDGAPDANLTPIVTKYTKTFLPDIIVLAGTAEVITKVMKPIEAAWPATTPPPQYVLIDSTKGPDLTTLVTGNDLLRARIRGTGITSGPPISGAPAPNTPADTFLQFQLDYVARYPGLTATTSGMGPSRDAAYAIGLALAATRTEDVTGASVAQGLRKLAGGTTTLELNSSNVLTAMKKLGGGEKINAVGTFGMLDWDADGAVKGGTLEIWCIGSAAAKPFYGSSGLTYDILTKKRLGEYKPCPVTL